MALKDPSSLPAITRMGTFHNLVQIHKLKVTDPIGE